MTELANTGLIHNKYWDDLEPLVDDVASLRSYYNPLQQESETLKTSRNTYISQNNNYEEIIQAMEDPSAGYTLYKTELTEIMNNANTVIKQLYTIYTQMLQIVDSMLKIMTTINNYLTNYDSELKQDTDGCYDILYNACLLIVSEYDDFVSTRSNIASNLNNVYLGRWVNGQGVVWDVVNDGN